MSPTMADDLVLELRPSSSRDVRVPLAARGPAQFRRREDSMSPPVVESSFKRARVPDPTSPTVSYESDGGEDASMLSVAMRDHFEGIEVRPDCQRQQLYSCVANGKLYNDADIAILSSVLKGADITEVFSPERVTKLF